MEKANANFERPAAEGARKAPERSPESSAGKKAESIAERIGNRFNIWKSSHQLRKAEINGENLNKLLAKTQGELADKQAAKVRFEKELKNMETMLHGLPADIKKKTEAEREALINSISQLESKTAEIGARRDIWAEKKAEYGKVFEAESQKFSKRIEAKLEPVNHEIQEIHSRQDRLDKEIMNFNSDIKLYQTQIEVLENTIKATEFKSLRQGYQDKIDVLKAGLEDSKGILKSKQEQRHYLEDQAVRLNRKKDKILSKKNSVLGVKAAPKTMVRETAAPVETEENPKHNFADTVKLWNDRFASEMPIDENLAKELAGEQAENGMNEEQFEDFLRKYHRHIVTRRSEMNIGVISSERQVAAKAKDIYKLLNDRIRV